MERHALGASIEFPPVVVRGITYCPRNEPPQPLPAYMLAKDFPKIVVVSMLVRAVPTDKGSMQHSSLGKIPDSGHHMSWAVWSAVFVLLVAIAGISA